ncbi:MAG TPA: cytochrome oxidase small assembly protein [Burkholderiales bacterium]|nr:cytochrome oxidase small assembly protein [Burkholderiales bacterium]
MTRDQHRGNLRTALVLGSIALVFFLGIMLKYFLLK